MTVIKLTIEVVSVMKSAFMVPVAEMDSHDLLGDVGRILTEIFGGVLKFGYICCHQG